MGAFAFNVLAADTKQAIAMTGKDFEDALQAVCAATYGCDYLITRNEKDFKIGKGLSSKIHLPTVSSPRAFVEHCFSLARARKHLLWCSDG